MIKQMDVHEELCTCGRQQVVLVNELGQVGVVCWGHTTASALPADRRRTEAPRLAREPIVRGLMCPSWCIRPKNHEGGCRASQAAIAAVAATSDTVSPWARDQVKAPKEPRRCVCGTPLPKRFQLCATCKGNGVKVRQNGPAGPRTFKPRECTACHTAYQPTGPRGTVCPGCK